MGNQEDGEQMVMAAHGAEVLKRAREPLELRWRAMSLTIAVTVLLDQVTKWLVVQEIPRGGLIEIVPGFFNLVLTENRGAAFGMLAGLAPGVREAMLALTTVLALCVVVFVLFTECRRDLVGQLALSLVVGGALGNIIDRVRIGAVIDFLDFYINTYHWPAFNVADSAICVGIALLLLRRGRSSPATEPR